MKTMKQQAALYAESLNDIADILDLPAGQTAQEIVEAVRCMRDDWAKCRESLVGITVHIEESNYYGGFAASKGASKVLREVYNLAGMVEVTHCQPDSQT